MRIYEFQTEIKEGKILTNDDFTLKEHSNLDFLRKNKRYKVTIEEVY